MTPDFITTTDHSINNTGSVNVSPVWGTAATTHSNNGRTMYVPAGSYLLNTSIGDKGGHALEFEYGTKILQGVDHWPQGTTDGSVIGRTGKGVQMVANRMSTQQQVNDAKAADRFSDLDNEFTTFSGMLIPSSMGASVISFEKAASYSRADIRAASTYGANEKLRDAVGHQSMGVIRGTFLGRAWAGHDYVMAGHPDDPGDGYAVGREIEVYNYGTNQPLFDTPTSKYALTLMCRQGNATAAMYIVQGGAAQNGSPAPKFHHGIFAKYGTVLQTFITLENRFKVDSEGRVGLGVGETEGNTLINGTVSSGIARGRLRSQAANGQSYWAFEKPGVVAYSVGVDNASGEFRISHVDGLAAGQTMFSMGSDVGIGFFGAPNFGGGKKVISINNATTAPTANNPNGGILYVEGGAQKFRGGAGKVTIIATAS